MVGGASGGELGREIVPDARPDSAGENGGRSAERAACYPIRATRGEGQPFRTIQKLGASPSFESSETWLATYHHLASYVARFRR